jgi:Fic family protein
MGKRGRPSSSDVKSNGDDSGSLNKKRRAKKERVKYDPFDPDKVKRLGKSHGWKMSAVKKSSAGMIAMEKGTVRINIWPTTCTVGTYLEHPTQGKTQLYRGHNSYKELEDIFKDPRKHTGKGYHNKKNERKAYLKTGKDILLASRLETDKFEPDKKGEWVKKAIENCNAWSASSLNSDECLSKYKENKQTKRAHLQKHKNDKLVAEGSPTEKNSHYDKVVKNYSNIEAQLADLVKECKVPKEDGSTGATSSASDANGLSARNKVDRVNHSIFKKNFTPGFIKSLHYILMDGVTSKLVGEVRKTNVHVGSIGFTPPEHVEKTLEEYCCSLLYILNNRHDISMFGIAGFAVFHFLDLHPFADGNGRISRAIGNMCLQICGLPFTVDLAPNPMSRKMFGLAMRSDRAKKGQCFCSKSILHTVWKTWEEYRQFAISHKEATMAKKIDTAVDEKSKKRRADKAKEECVICFNAEPNITTICCDQVYHLHCLLKCIREKKNCPTCRKEFSFEEDEVAPDNQNDDEDAAGDTEDTSDTENTSDTEDTDYTSDTGVRDTDTDEVTGDTSDTGEVDSSGQTSDTFDTSTSTSENDASGFGRDCAACNRNKDDDYYSKNQWSKGPGYSRCRECVESGNWHELV